MRHFAISAANFSISTLVLQKQHRFKHKRRFSQVNKHKISTSRLQWCNENTEKWQCPTFGSKFANVFISTT